MTRSRLAAAAACVLTVLSATALGWTRPPEPDPLPKRWQLDLDVGPLRVATVETETTGSQVYYYLTYRVTNNSGEDQAFAPVFELGTDEGELFRAGKDVPRAVKLEMLERLDNPLIEGQIAILGTLLQGKENAKDGLVIWPVGDLDIDEISVYAAGFSGEMTKIEFTDPESGESTEITLRKTMMVQYDMPGSLERRGSKPIKPKAQRWIMR
jgi:hypothetical protein